GFGIRGATSDPVTLLQRVFATRKTVHVSDLLADRAYVERAPAATALVDLGGARSTIVVPMLRNEEIIGTIFLYRAEAKPFDAKQIEVVENFAAQAEIAIENARLLDELRESLETQTASADILRAIASSPGDAERVLQTIADTAQALFGASRSIIARIEGDVF